MLESYFLKTLWQVQDAKQWWRLDLSMKKQQVTHNAFGTTTPQGRQELPSNWFVCTKELVDE